MEYLTDRNEPQRRHWALLLTIALHLAVAIGIYLSVEKTQEQPKQPVAAERKA